MGNSNKRIPPEIATFFIDRQIRMLSFLAGEIGKFLRRYGVRKYVPKSSRKARNKAKAIGAKWKLLVFNFCKAAPIYK